MKITCSSSCLRSLNKTRLPYTNSDLMGKILPKNWEKNGQMVESISDETVRKVLKKAPQTVDN